MKCHAQMALISALLLGVASGSVGWAASKADKNKCEKRLISSSDFFDNTLLESQGSGKVPKGELLRLRHIEGTEWQDVFGVFEEALDNDDLLVVQNDDEDGLVIYMMNRHIKSEVDGDVATTVTVLEYSEKRQRYLVSDEVKEGAPSYQMIVNATSQGAKVWIREKRENTKKWPSKWSLSLVYGNPAESAGDAVESTSTKSEKPKEKVKTRSRVKIETANELRSQEPKYEFSLMGENVKSRQVEKLSVYSFGKGKWGLVFDAGGANDQVFELPEKFAEAIGSDKLDLLDGLTISGRKHGLHAKFTIDGYDHRGVARLNIRFEDENGEVAAEIAGANLWKPPAGSILAGPKFR